ncbi:MAG TPA: hypothetical protein VGW35_10280 [Methylomirabilota bacterium]|nr:hypothetical protein [Methylomirabilota bacterium]
MRVAVLTATLGVVLAASALNLVLGGLWVAGVVSLTLWRRRMPSAAWLVLVLTLAAATAFSRLGWLTAPAARSYEADELAWLGAGLWGPAPPARTAESDFESRRAALRARLARRRQMEFRVTGRELGERAALAIAVSREIGRLRDRAPAEVAGVEHAARRLALTLTAPEFRDLDGRATRLAEWFADLDAHFTAARDAADLDTAARALEAPAMAAVSLGALREDLARVDAASAALVRALAGQSVGVTAAGRLEYAEARGELVVEDRYAFTAPPPVRITRLDVRPLRKAAIGAGSSMGTVQTLAYGLGTSELRELGGENAIAVETGVARVMVVDRRTRPVTPVPIRAVLRPIPFHRLGVPSDDGSPAEFPIRVALGEAPGVEAGLQLAVGPRRLEETRLPGYAFHDASLPGTLTRDGAHDVWAPADSQRAAAPAADLRLELVPPNRLLRNRAFARLAPYLYVPNLTVTLALVGLVALTSILTRRRGRPALPPAGSEPGR